MRSDNSFGAAFHARQVPPISRNRLFFWLAAVVAPFLPASIVIAQTIPQYRITEVGHFGFVGPNNVEAVNNRGEVVGWNIVEQRPFPGGIRFITRGYHWADGVGGQLASVPDGDYSWASDINDDGLIVGRAQQQDATFVACLLVPGAPARPIELAGGRAISANAINRHGLIVGGAQRDDGTLCPYAYDLVSGTTYFVTIPGVSGAALAVNDAGRMVGRYVDAAGIGHPFAAAVGQPPTDLNSLLPPNSAWRLDHAVDINNFGVIVGSGQIAGQVRSYRGSFDGADPEPLAPLPGDLESRVAAINDAGLAVGHSFYSALPAARWTAVVWTFDGVVDINTRIVDAPPALWFEGVRDLNQSGHLVARGVYDAPRQYLLTPICPEDVDGNGVVELSDLAILLSCVGSGTCGDFDADGDTDLADLARLLARFGGSCP